MFWVIFDTSTKRDYYRDVHNILAMPAGSIYRYDYRTKYFSPSALAEIQKTPRSAKVLLIYAQAHAFQKGEKPPIGSIAFGQGLWVGTRLATLRGASFAVDQYYFDLQLGSYPAPNEQALSTILRALADANEVPFSKWVAISALDENYRVLCEGADPENWAAIVNKLGIPPSQFGGDSFWRIARISTGEPAEVIKPEVEERKSGGSSKSVALFPANSLSRLRIEIESRLPQTEQEPPEGETEARNISFSCTAECLAAFNGRTQPLRRYQHVDVDGEIAPTERYSALDCQLHLSTGPAPTADHYPIGPDFSLDLRVSMAPFRLKMGVLSGIVGTACVVIGVVVVRDHAAWGAILVVVGLLLGMAMHAVMTGKFKLPGTK
jgi:hypothetical protein